MNFNVERTAAHLDAGRATQEVPDYVELDFAER